MALFIGMVVLTARLWRITPGSLVPDEDQGYYIAAVILPDGATLQRTDQVVSQVVEIIQSNPANEDAVAFTGLDFIGGGFRNNAATIFVTQKHWDERNVATPQLVGEFFMKTAHIKEALVLAFGPPPIFGLGNAGGFEFYIQNRGEGGPKRLAEVMGQFLAQREPGPDAGQVQTLWRANVPQLYVDVDREKAKALGVPLDEAVQHARRHARHLLRQRLQQVRPHLAGADVRRARIPQAARTIGAIYVRSDKGEMVPLKALADVRYLVRPGLARPVQQPAGGEAARARCAGRSSGQAIAGVEEIASEVLPPTSASTGAVLRSRRSGRPAPRRSRSGWPW